MIQFINHLKKNLIFNIGIILSITATNSFAIGTITFSLGSGLDFSHSEKTGDGTADKTAKHIHELRLKLLHERFSTLAPLSSAKPIIQQNELEELQISWLANSIDTCQTLFGSWALQKLLAQPIADKQTIMERQELIRIISNDEKLAKSIKDDLTIIAQLQHSMVDHVTKIDSVLRDKTESLYFALPWGIGDYLNKSRLALDGVMIYELGKTTSSLLALIGLEGVQHGFFQMMTKNNAKFEPLTWIANGLKGPINNLNFWSSPLVDRWTQPGKDGKIKDPSWKKYIKAVHQGTLLDRCKAIQHGYKRKIEVNLPAPEFVKNITAKIIGGQTSPVSSIIAVPISLAYSVGYYLIRFMQIRSAYYYLRSTQTKMENSHTFMITIAQFVRTMRHLAKTMIRHPEMQQTFLGQEFKRLFDRKNHSAELKELFELFDTSTFNFSSASSLVYSRGRILLAYKLLDKTLNELTPMLRAVGLLDMFNIFADRINDPENPWHFVEFIDAKEPAIIIEDFKTPVYANAVANSIVLGNGQPTKLIITGPNMGGKSAIIRLMLGHSVIFAHSSGVAPAKLMRTTIMDGLLTSINPQEDMKRGISKFGAVYLAMERIYAALKTFDPNKHYMILIDEPYDGTVNDETARRTGELLEWSIGKDNTIITVASHIQPQVHRSRQNAFAYKHVEILEPTPGNFIRTFKLVPEIDHEWFFNHERRKRFIDWLGTLGIRKDMPEGSAAA